MKRAHLIMLARRVPRLKPWPTTHQYSSRGMVRSRAAEADRRKPVETGSSYYAGASCTTAEAVAYYTPILVPEHSSRLGGLPGPTAIGDHVCPPRMLRARSSDARSNRLVTSQGNGDGTGVCIRTYGELHQGGHPPRGPCGGGRGFLPPQADLGTPAALETGRASLTGMARCW